MNRTPDQLAEACAEEMYRNDQASPRLGIKITKVSRGYAEATMTVTDLMINGHGVCHGGYLFTLADTAFAFACNTYDHVTYASSGAIEFLARAQLGDELLARAEEHHRGRRAGVYDVTVTDQNGTLIAMFRGRSVSLNARILADSD